MYNGLPSPHLALAILGACLLYFLIIFLAYRKRFFSLFSSNVLPAGPGTLRVAGDVDLPPLIDKPADHPTAQADLPDDGDEPDEPYLFDLPEDEDILLKEAEKVVEEIQETVNEIVTRHESPGTIALHPISPEEVFTAVRIIVQQYPLFRNTEYFEAINNFVAITVRRDCNLTLTADDLAALWEVPAA
ncbi:hypothetical protein [Dinghuibacter silviterrae]|uniref:Uncharacterized protein n=1 Tax=Dinghuibacter silviterrae TaxID=1539049 RepID=A0A4R8DHZ5_9BACT|nr:hypothetical protein [Dinghuibacter silviterrae]TDW97098.1 hypothetical protein EDB95_4938 [Dinghuibacter silviterrae]